MNSHLSTAVHTWKTHRIWATCLGDPRPLADDHDVGRPPPVRGPSGHSKKKDAAPAAPETSPSARRRQTALMRTRPGMRSRRGQPPSLPTAGGRPLAGTSSRAEPLAPPTSNLVCGAPTPYLESTAFGAMMSVPHQTFFVVERIKESFCSGRQLHHSPLLQSAVYIQVLLLSV